MSVVQDILKDEKARLEQLLMKYNNDLEMLPRGSLSKKKRGSHYYVYLAYRQDDKIIFIYIGKEHSDKVVNLEKQIQDRKSLEKKIRNVKSDLAEVKRGLRGRK